MEITPIVLMNTLLQNVQTQYQRIGQLQEEASTGQRFQVPSDSPSRVTATMNLNTALAQTKAYETAATQAQNWLNTTSGALQNMQQIWQNVLNIAVEASNNTLTATDREALVIQVQQAQKALGQLLNTRYEGTYIFNGYNSQTAPISSSGTTNFPTNQQLQTFQIGESSSVTVNLTGNENVGQPSGSNYFATIYNDLSGLQSAITQGASASQTYISTLKTDQSYLSTAQSIVGGRLERVNQTKTQLQSLSFNLNQTIAQISGANMASVTVELAQEEQAYQAALQSGAQILPLSLLNFIHP
ncbi:flagellar hook-associated protein FlgL [Sulfobacillus thermosulfidooxidans]|uniref:flagellar hook-associated protein FlgL n=1 Tax=Sulfobacillus thermosulfidooxidans TaxID=28034 RepID=UPI00096BAF21|nr:flagellar hook-associated protein FlgL [Sulfobacillus thermosulfidooxidans]OLZ10242.1 flagellar hook-associated protein 3 [Sulfobacillus thermosulfidooxidans]OLZ17034.1 flagellar hook-associated protein 3 [Sulfobacillus thermosulfidooxidans]OLZ20130.1 flagellar hook-associated protein 3 [Sulfobacillus thermosulfidooxidans]